MMCVDPNITDVTQKRLCCNVLGEDVGRVVDGVDLDNPHKVMCDQLLYKQVFELDVFGLAFFDDPILVAMLFPLAESVRMRMLIFFMLRASFRRLLMCRASVAPVLIAYSSASALLSAIVLTVFCRRSGLLLQRL